jgi:hypothetical protein
LARLDEEEINNSRFSQDVPYLWLPFDELTDLPDVLGPVEDVFEQTKCRLVDLLYGEGGSLVGQIHHLHLHLGLVVEVELQDLSYPSLDIGLFTLVLMLVPSSS